MQLTKRQIEKAMEAWRSGKSFDDKLNDIAPYLQSPLGDPTSAEMRCLVEGAGYRWGSNEDVAIEVALLTYIRRYNARLSPDERLAPIVKVLRQSYMKRCMGELPDYENLAEELLRTVDALSA